MASPQRVARLQEEIKRESSDILRKMKDPRLGFVTVTDVEVSSDLGFVRIFVSVFGDDDAMAKSMAALRSGTGFVRTELGKRIRLRHTPEIVFQIDESARRGACIEHILAELQRPKEAPDEL